MFYDTDRERLTVRVRARVPAGTAEKMVALIRPTVGFRPGAAAAGLSRLGGRPDLPAGTEWPISTIMTYPSWLDRVMFWRPAPAAAFERPQAFVAQIDLAALPAGHLDLALPRHGLLLVFHDGREFGPVPTAPTWRVVHVEAAGPQRAPPAGAVEFAVVGLVAEAGWIAPPQEFTPAPEHGLSPEDLEHWIQAFDDEDDMSEPPPVRLGGWPWPVQGGVEEAAQHAATALGLKTRASDWRLLLEVDSVPEASMTWADSGSLYFQMTADDLQARRWERANCEMQCC